MTLSVANTSSKTSAASVHLDSAYPAIRSENLHRLPPCQPKNTQIYVEKTQGKLPASYLIPVIASTFSPLLEASSDPAQAARGASLATALLGFGPLEELAYEERFEICPGGRLQETSSVQIQIERRLLILNRLLELFLGKSDYLHSPTIAWTGPSPTTSSGSAPAAPLHR
nr:hypothetical protein Iba_chr11aCG13710 [Ipomoea batatas]